MRCLLSAVVMALFSFSASAAEDAKPNTLTPKEIADGWLLLFDGGTTFGWRADGEIKVEDGSLALGGNKETKVQFWFGFFKLNWEWRSEGAEAPTMVQELSLTEKPRLRCTNRRKLASPDKGKSIWQREQWESYYDVHDTAFGFDTVQPPPGSWSRVTLHVPAGSKLFLRGVKLQPLGLKPIFNGKDLTGWRKVVTDRTKSEFSVSNGELRIKSGPGDLETEGQWDDFVLQLDCRTNGRHLNSGVFFRCIPGQYLRGYEVQIHNNFTAEPPREYAVEEFDPETHKLIGKKKVQSAATDFGTGAIYRRVPARKQLAKDNEWFTMTIVAEGKHFAVWINGVQVSDWTDNRPPHENPRVGCRLEKGTISLQGHDPTTDLSFRNFRIAALPKKP